MAERTTRSFRSSMTEQLPSLHHEHPSYRWWVLLNVMIGTFMAVLDSTIVNVSLPKIMATFGTSVDKAEWILTGYLLVFAVMLPSSGWIADHFGYKRTYIFSFGLFTFGSFLCGLAWDENALIFFRIIQGIGGGLLMPIGMAIILREFPVEQRGTALGFWGISAAASVSFGPLAGGYLVDNFSWHAIFDVNVPIGIVGVLATFLIQREYKTEKARGFDFVGFASVTVFLVAILLALSDGNASWNDGGWTSPFILWCFAISAASFTVFLITEFTVEHPLIDLQLFKYFNYSMANIVLFVFGFAIFGSTFLLPLYLQNSMGYSATQVGMMFLPSGIVQGLMSPVSGLMGDKLNPKVPAILGMVFLCYSWYLSTTLSLFSPYSEIMMPLYMRGIGLGLLFTPLSSLAYSEIPKVKMAQASGLFNVIRQIGGSFGVAVIGAMLSTRTLTHMQINGQAIDIHSPYVQQIAGRLQYFALHTSSSTADVAALRAKSILGTHLANQAFVQGVDDVFLFSFIIIALGIIPLIFLRVPKKTTGETHIALE